MLSLEEIVSKISEQVGLDNISIQQKIEDKKAELSGLISSEGAAHLVARDLNVDILTRVTHKLEIKNIVPGMRNTEITARVFRVFAAREFERNGNKGRVSNIVLWDPTGTIRMSLWNDEIKILENLKEGDIVKVMGYSKEDNRGEPELRLGNRGKIEKVDIEFPSINNAVSEQKGGNLGELREGVTTKIRGAIVQMFESDPFYEICPQCGIRVRANDNKFFCDEHQYVAPDYSMVLSCVIDDGTMSMRAVFFRDVAQKLIGMDVQTALSLARERMNRTAPITEKAPNLLGREMLFSGRVKRNQMFDRLEFIVSDINEINPIEESDKILVAMGG
ncbi:MAG: hypothetical protein HYT71_00760 [Candidatus Aenigmarchaeota archaeon]|nr:hypothetical protein [Candidatus Aenigmarchaeota archaeon]